MLDWLKRFEENSVHAPHGVHRIEAKLALLRLRGTARPAWNVGGDGPELEAIADRSETSDGVPDAPAHADRQVPILQSPAVRQQGIAAMFDVNRSH